jgi:xanthine/CO dehydrogenase XdhC/CoxF family maturation factor
MITHELKRIVEAHEKAQMLGKTSVLATVVALEGSSYRRPGVRMLVLNDGTMIGAVSGGCVEKEVYRQAQSVFQTKMPKVMTYDGRYRLGCEGILYILLEPFRPSSSTINSFWKAIEKRYPFELLSHFNKEYSESTQYGSQLRINGIQYSLCEDFEEPKGLQTFHQILPPCFKLIIIGTEHDAVQLCSMAALLGWEVTIVAHPKEEKTRTDFPGCTNFINAEAETWNLDTDAQTAILLMTHSYVKDLQFLMALKEQQSAYFGVLGPARRREKLFNELLEHCPDTPLEFIESIYGPAGLELGAETPQEISLSVLAEILAVINKKDAIPLREKAGRIHL